ncbi:hypothetical protein ACFWPK_22460 [Nocardia sp. NPDC058519]|uniref:hypothetical protein n=1 Tax=Nocardia sp. NPDC058519 TaxID=3346535 RepID=UPI0036626B7B
MRLGKLPARINATMLNLSSYLDPALRQRIPADFGYDHTIADYPMLGADELAVSVWAGAAHETLLWAREAGDDVEFDADTIASDYAACTGYDKSQPETDRGTDLQAAASYRRRAGIVDTAGRRHRIGAYVSITPGDPDELAAAAYIFGAVGVGWRLPAYAVEDISAGRPWDVRHGMPPLAGGHYTPVVARRGGFFYAITHGRAQEFTERFYRRYCDEAIAYLPPDLLGAGAANAPGLDIDRLVRDMKAFVRR